jgi:hypothetical protein
MISQRVKKVHVDSLFALFSLLAAGNRSFRVRCTSREIFKDRVIKAERCNAPRRYIKMSSPHLNNLIIVGCMLTYSSVIFLGLDSQLSSVTAFPYICTARAWLLMAGFSLAFGSMFSKTWRVHSIFTDVKLNKKVRDPTRFSQLFTNEKPSSCSSTRAYVTLCVHLHRDIHILTDL